jgi:hypothetical protein
MIDPQQWNMYSYARGNPIFFIDPDGKLATPFHEELTAIAFGKRGYSTKVIAAINYNNGMTDKWFNDPAHAYYHYQTAGSERPTQTPDQAHELQRDLVAEGISEAAISVWAGDFAAAHYALGVFVLHPVQDEKHDLVSFDVHTGDPLNDLLTTEGAKQIYSDYNPTKAQLDRALVRTTEMLDAFEAAVRRVGKSLRRSDAEIDERLHAFRNNLKL